MPCDTRLREGQKLVDRMAEVKKALEDLQRRLGQGIVSVVIAPNGAVVFKGWAQTERQDLSDACAYRTLAANGSWELRRAVAKAEAMQGRKVNPQALTAGWHSHDGGKTWGTH